MRVGRRARRARLNRDRPPQVAVRAARDADRDAAEVERPKVTANIVCIHVAAESLERAVELSAADEEENEGEKVTHVKGNEHGYGVRWRLANALE